MESAFDLCGACAVFPYAISPMAKSKRALALEKQIADWKEADLRFALRVALSLLHDDALKEFDLALHYGQLLLPAAPCVLAPSLTPRPPVN